MAFAGAAQANSYAQIDVNGLEADAGGAFSTTFSGTISLSKDANASFNGVKINEVDQGVDLSTWTLSAFTGSITLSSGTVTGGSFSVSVTDGSTTDTYAATITSSSGDVDTQSGQGFNIDGLTFAGTFSSSTFAGVDVSNAFSIQPLTGSFLNFAFSPDSSGFDSDADMDIFVVIPLPAGAGLGLAGLAGLACVRRRRI